MRGHCFCLSIVIGCFVATSGCGDDSTTDDPSPETTLSSATGGTGGTGGEGGAPPVVFGACPEGYTDECATLQTPLDHTNPDGETIDLHIARKRAKQPAKRQLWLLAGGPGQGGHIWSALMPSLAKALPDTDVYTIDHRGTGHSHRLTCTGQDKPNSYGGYSLDPDAVPECLAELQVNGDYDRLAHFTTAQAARDVILAIRATRAAGQTSTVLGGSYGTHWAHRVLQVGEAEVESVIFDGFMTPEKFAFTQYDRGVDEVGAVLSAGCATDAECAARMGPDPALRARDIWAALDADPCYQIDGHYGRTLVSLFVDAGLAEKAFVFPLLHRLERCSPEDYDAIHVLFGNLGYGASSASGAGGTGGGELFLNSGVLQYNIVLSELWSIPGEALPTQSDLESAADAQTFLVGRSYPAGIVELRETWPLPPDDHTSLPTPVLTNKPLLWLSGGLDSRTPPAQAALVTSLYDAPNQPLLILPTAVHTPAWGSPLASNPNETCGQRLVPSFMQGALDTSCVDDFAPVPYHAPSAAFAMQWWGTSDDWGDGKTAAAPSLAAEPIAISPVAISPIRDVFDPLGASRARQAADEIAVRLRAGRGARAEPAGAKAAPQQ